MATKKAKAVSKKKGALVVASADRKYNLKPEWTNLFQILYDAIDDYDASPEVKAKMKELWEMLKTALIKYGEDALIEIVNMLLNSARSNLTNYVL